MNKADKKIISTTQLAKLVRKYQKENKTVGCLSGSFDLMIGRHFKSLWDCSKHCDVLIALINSDVSVSSYKGSGKPYLHENERSFILSQAECLDHISVFDDVTPVQVLERVRPDIFFNTNGWGEDCVEKIVIEKHGGKIMSFDIDFPDSWMSSSTNLVKRIISSESNQGKPAVFLDRDGVINKNKEGYIYKWSDFEFKPHVLSSLKRLTKAGFPLFIVTNQSGIGRGFYTENDLLKLNRTLVKYLKNHGINIQQIYFCPHHPDDGCLCRKPSPTFHLQAAKDHNLNLSKSWFIGDSEADIGSGRQSNTPTILIGNQNCKLYKPNYTAMNLKQAVDIILSKSQ